MREPLPQKQGVCVLVSEGSMGTSELHPDRDVWMSWKVGDGLSCFVRGGVWKKVKRHIIGILLEFSLAL